MTKPKAKRLPLAELEAVLGGLNALVDRIAKLEQRPTPGFAALVQDVADLRTVFQDNTRAIRDANTEASRVNTAINVRFDQVEASQAQQIERAKQGPTYYGRPLIDMILSLDTFAKQLDHDLDKRCQHLEELCAALEKRIDVRIDQVNQASAAALSIPPKSRAEAVRELRDNRAEHHTTSDWTQILQGFRMWLCTRLDIDRSSSVSAIQEAVDRLLRDYLRLVTFHTEVCNLLGGDGAGDHAVVVNELKVRLAQAKDDEARVIELQRVKAGLQRTIEQLRGSLGPDPADAGDGMEPRVPPGYFR